jgi:crotonobetainyl-CoA:carnitine CoA-transferase CaiB-like acyl-CoA transferase
MVTGQPLTGHRVVDLTRFVSGAFATMTLSALGADVIKIEGLPHGDPYRAQGTSFVDGRSSLFLGLNTGKRSVALDLRSPVGRSLVDRLLSSADILVENGRPGALTGSGLDYESVHARHPGVVYGSISGYGPVGPDAGSGGFDVILQAESGIMSVTGTEASGPVKVGVPLLDVGAGVSCVAGILAALVERQRTGLGRHVSSSLLEFAMAGFVGSVTSHFHNGASPGLLGSHSPTFAPYGAFRCSDDHLVIAGSGAERLWGVLCGVLGRPRLLTDARFVTNADRVRHRDELTRELESVLVTRPAAEWASRLRREGVPVGSVRTLADVLTSPQVGALDLIRSQQVHGTCYSTVGPPLQIDGPLPYPRPAPDLGEHTQEVLETLGLSRQQISDLHDEGQVLVG